MGLSGAGEIEAGEAGRCHVRAALQQFVAASGAGYGREDDAAVAKIYTRDAELKLPGPA